MACNKVITKDGRTLLDLTEDDVAQEDVLQGKKFHGRDGVGKTGTYVPPVLIPKTIKKNGTYDPTDDNADGYSSVEVDVTGVGIKVTDPIAYRAANRDPNYPDVPLPSEITDNGDWFYLLYSAKDKFVCPKFQLNGGTLISAKRCKYLNKTLVAENDIPLVLGTDYHEQFDSDDSDWGDYNYILYKINISGATTIAFYNYTYNGTASNNAQSSLLIEASIKATNLTTATIHPFNGFIHSNLEYFSMTGYKGNTASAMFRDCHSLKAVCELDTPNVTTMNNMFYNCYCLQAIPLIDTSMVSNMQAMFRGCYSLTTIPSLSTANVTTMQEMFYYCYSLITIPLLNTQNVTNMSSMFRECLSLEEIPALNTSNVTSMTYIFTNCSSLKVIPNLVTPLLNNVNYMLQYCYNLQAIGSLNFSSVSSLSSFDPFGSLSSLVSFKVTGMKASFRLNGSNFLSESAIVEVLNNLATVSTTQTLTLGSTLLAKLTEEEKAIATNKGWTLA